MVADAPEPSGPVIHSHRVIAESFGDDPERYDRARPRYPRALADAVIALLPGPRIVDVGIGTGISAGNRNWASARNLVATPAALEDGYRNRLPSCVLSRRVPGVVHLGTVSVW